MKKIIKIAKELIIINKLALVKEMSKAPNFISGPIEFDLAKKKLRNFRYEGETCIYCQASASLLAKNINKLNLDNLSELKSMG